MSTYIPESKLIEYSILVVDDIPAARRVVVRILKMLGFRQVVEATNMEEATAQLQRTKFDLVITDLHLKDTLGTDLIKQTRANARNNKDVPFIVVTADMDKNSFKEAIESGVASYLLKPFSPDLLMERMTSALTAGKSAGQ